LKNKINIKVLFLIIASSIFLAVIYNSFSINSIDFIKKENRVKTLNSIDIIGLDDSTKILKGLSLVQTSQLFNDDNVILVDARDKWEFADSHIKGAINIPQYSFEPQVTDLSMLSKDEIIIVYCSADDCSMSKRLAEQFLELGYYKTYVYLGGITEWIDAQLPIETSELK
jgi:rhodanese-related sulfurtransferase